MKLKMNELRKHQQKAAWKQQCETETESVHVKQITNKNTENAVDERTNEWRHQHLLY